MNSIRTKSPILGVIALTLLSFTLAAAPASALEELTVESGIQAEGSFGDEIVGAVSGWTDSFLSFLLELGDIFANQSGASIVD